MLTFPFHSQLTALEGKAFSHVVSQSGGGAEIVKWVLLLPVHPGIVPALEYS